MCEWVAGWLSGWIELPAMFLRLVLRVNSSMLPLNSAFVACRFLALSGEQVEALPPALAQQEEMQALRNLEGFVLVSNRVRGSCACFLRVGDVKCMVSCKHIVHMQ